MKELEKNLNQSTAKWKIVLGHHPVYSYGEHGNTAELIEGLKPILEVSIRTHINCFVKVNKFYK